MLPRGGGNGGKVYVFMGGKATTTDTVNVFRNIWRKTLGTTSGLKLFENVETAEVVCESRKTSQDI